VVFDVTVVRDVGIEMRDGVGLISDIYLPSRDGKAAAGPFSTVLVRTTYNKDLAQGSIDAEAFTRHGYAVVIQDVRGRYKSPGNYYHGIFETEDGADTIDWIARQPWSDGKVGMTGISYLAAVQCAAACSGTPHLSSIFHVKAPSSYYQNGFRHSGTFLMYTIPITLMFAATDREPQYDPVLLKSLTDAYERAPEWLSRAPLKPGLNPLSRVPGVEQWLFDMATKADFDDFWKKVPLWEPEQHVDDYADVPGYYVGGWYDLYHEETFYPLLAGRKRGPIKLLMGPWSHMGFERVVGDVDFGPEAAMSYRDYIALQLRWFDATLKGESSGLLEEPPVKIFVMGGGSGRKTVAGQFDHGGRWRHEQEWPLARTVSTNYYFHPNALLSDMRPTEAESSLTYRYDPNDPVPTIGGTSYFIQGNTSAPNKRQLFVPYGPQDQREDPDYFACSTHLPLSTRQDILVFQTPPLDEDVEVTGPLLAHLWVSSTAVDTDFTAKLIDVAPPNEDYPDGYAMNLADGIIRMRYRDSFERPELMTPGEIYRCTIELFPTSNLFKQGHRIRVDLSSSNYPAYDPNPNTGGPTMVAGAPPIVAQNTIFLDAEHPSHIVLPIIPA
jgi:putative CocE/NonD family hydrolase